MNQFIRDLLSDKQDALSSKRFIAIMFSFVIVIIALINLFFGKTIEEFIFWGLVTLIGSMAGASTLQNIKTISSKGNVAESIIENSPVDKQGTEAAKNIVQNNKSE